MAAVSRYPYGNSIGTPPSPYGYTSGYRTAAGIYHYGARYYDSATQRWTQQDPLSQIVSPTGADRYGYAGGDPVNGSDPSGLLCADSNCKTTWPRGCLPGQCPGGHIYRSEKIFINCGVGAGTALLLSKIPVIGPRLLGKVGLAAAVYNCLATVFGFPPRVD
jgi:RHS repeat-associated protein